MINDQRSSPRHDFPYQQLVAMVADGKMPASSDFHTVPCENVSRGGIAFFLNEEPTAQEYVVALGPAWNLSYLCARVAHTRRAIYDGKLWYRVACRFTGRASFDHSTLTVVRMGE